MKIHCLTVGGYATNSFVLEDGVSAVIIDPGAEPERFIKLISSHRLDPLAILITHGHGDHIGAVGVLREKYPEAPVICHLLDAPMLSDSRRNMSVLDGVTLDVGQPDRTVNDGDTLEFGKIRFRVLHVPGHTPGHVVFLRKGIVFAGDTLFAGGIGRWDLTGGDGPLLIRSLKSKLLTLPDETVVWPGHGPKTTIGIERATNPYLSPGFDFENAYW